MYICLEGIDGSGKSTQIKMLKEWFATIGQQVFMVKEPTESDIGKLLRNMLESTRATEDNFQNTLALLFAADRTVLMEDIMKAEFQGKVVISDRCFYSSIVYQNDGEWISQINKHAKKPDITILLDLDVETALHRCDGTDQFENRDFLEKVRRNTWNLPKKRIFLLSMQIMV